MLHLHSTLLLPVKVPGKWTSLQFPQPGIYGEMPVSRAFLYIYFSVPSKGATLQIPLTELPQRESERCSVSRALHLLLKVLGKMSPSPDSPNGPLWRKLPVSRAFFYMSLGFPIKQGPLIKQKLAFLSKSLVKQCPSEYIWRKMLHFQS